MKPGIPDDEDRINPSNHVDKSVLLLDDNEIQLMTRRMILRNAGYSVHAALSPAEALAVVRDPEKGGALRLIVTDHLMPQMRGDAFITEVRKTLPHVSVVVITGLAEAESEYAGLDVQFLPKPCPPDCLLDHVGRVFHAPLHRTA